MNVVKLYWGMKLLPGLAIASLAFGCGAAAPTGEGEIAETQAPLRAECNGSTVTTQCWTLTGGHQVHALDDFNGFRWFVRATSVGFYTSVRNWYAPNGEWPAGYKDNGGNLSSNVRSVAVITYTGIGYVYALTEDGVVHQSFGRQEAANLNSPNGADFARWSVFAKPLDPSGNTLSLKQIVALLAPARWQPGFILLALDFSGRIYVQNRLVSGEYTWMPAAQHPGFSGLPASVFWAEISRSDAGGAYMLSSPQGGSAIYRAATGSTSPSGAVTWDPVLKLPPVVWRTPGAKYTQMLPTHVGGRYVITDFRNGEQCLPGQGCPGDAFRFFRYDTSSPTGWRPINGVSYIPSSSADLAQAPFNKQIWDTGTGFAVQVPYTHVDTYHL